MCVCVYLCMYVYMYVCIMYVCVYVCMSYVCTDVCMHICKMCVYVCTYVYMYLCNIVGNSSRTVIRRSNSGAGENFRTQTDRPRGPPILLYNRHPVSFPGVQRPWHPLLVPISCKGRAKTLLTPCTARYVTAQPSCLFM